jgi:hypothetical protein
MTDVHEIAPRVLQQGVARFERLEQLLLPVHGRTELVDQLLEVRSTLRAAAMTCAPQGRGGRTQSLRGGDERIVVAQQPVPRPQYVAVQGRLVQGQGPQRIDRPLMQRGVGRGAADRQIGEREQEAGGDGQ